MVALDLSGCSESWRARFWSRVRRNGPVVRADLAACWPWMGATDGCGYGVVRLNGRRFTASRIAYALTTGPVLDGVVIRHRCDNAICCNPEHLLPGSTADNNRDMIERGRLGVARGAANPKSKLTADLVREARAAWRKGESIASIARRMGVTIQSMHAVVHGRAWAHVRDEQSEVA